VRHTVVEEVGLQVLVGLQVRHDVAGQTVELQVRQPGVEEVGLQLQLEVGLQLLDLHFGLQLQEVGLQLLDLHFGLQLQEVGLQLLVDLGLQLLDLQLEEVGVQLLDLQLEEVGVQLLVDLHFGLQLLVDQRVGLHLHLE
jgi:hypothetical protein